MFSTSIETDTHLGRLREGNALNLDIDALGKLLDSNTAAGGLVDEPLGVLLVHALFYKFSNSVLTRKPEVERC